MQDPAADEETRTSQPPGSCTLSYRASLDVPRALAQRIARQLPIHRAAIGTRQGPRVVGYFAQAVLLRFMRQHAAIADLARDNSISLSTTYRCLRAPGG
ncbi:hypothetical protein ACFQ46_02260 [Kineococcus sp. GCM10028916]|uniref:hypothetical protein n=1 Tax=Kineococcus sp. GCM10028916 TaxID=3273394 RepID=UPI00362E76D7